ncbi:MAG TPA: hypothetical protein VIY08_01375 [Candidatus Nitrosocosmicus sp.]
MFSIPTTKSKLVNLYKKENDPKVKERLLLLIIKIREDKQIPFHVVKNYTEAIYGLLIG